MIQITLKIAKNGVRFIYADGKRVSYRKAEEIDMHNREESICNVLDSHFPTADTTTLKSTDFNLHANDGTFRLTAWIIISSSNLQLFPTAEIRFERGYKNVPDAVKALEYLKEYFGRNFTGGSVLSDQIGDLQRYYQILYRRGEYITINKLDDDNAEPNPDDYADDSSNDEYAQVARVEKLLAELPKDPNEENITMARYITSATAKKLGSTSWAIRSTGFNRAEKALEIYKSALAAHANDYDFAIGLAPKVIGTDDLIPIYYVAELDGSEEDNDCDNIFNLLPNLDELNDLSETDPYLMDDDAEYTERDARFNYGECYAAALTEKLSHFDSTVEVTYDIDDDDHDTYYLKFDGIYRSRYTLSGVESAFHRLKKDIAEEEFMKSVDGTLDDKIAALHQCRRKRKQVRDSINRAIKQCIRNRIGYLKSHNSKMEKYEYGLLCLLQGARRELEIA